jgi:hypothetical protein
LFAATKAAASKPDHGAKAEKYDFVFFKEITEEK